ncbi:molybdopterin-dependent oxidoreductase [Dongia rigui]|uniref:Molybdopterin-dependent oxidoreductase n=1 Tax=Dongia rigui TaxID=940149 RepID=A0ABU5DZ02_9PROT|nr:molybdopterin-dependent oxidoreductase [Dongia rigui]MDY0872164.1 molybdopterin-dependent oxidoreductase [Dongia rigui]
MALGRAAIIAAFILLAGLPPAAAVEPLPAPTGPVVLVLEGTLDAHNTIDGKAAFDMAMLQALPKTAFNTTTIWTDGLQTFEGVKIADLMARLGAKPAEFNALATNDYEMSFPASDALDHGAIIAYAQNGAAIPLDNKGPLWIVYPYDQDAELANDRYLSQSVWSLDHMTLY